MSPGEETDLRPKPNADVKYGSPLPLGLGRKRVGENVYGWEYTFSFSDMPLDNCVE